jgi:hypothetical protein
VFFRIQDDWERPETQQSRAAGYHICRKKILDTLQEGEVNGK